MTPEDWRAIHRAYGRLQDAFDWIEKLHRNLARRKINDLVTYALEDLDGVTWRHRHDEPVDVEALDWPDSENMDAADELIHRAVQDFDSEGL